MERDLSDLPPELIRELSCKARSSLSPKPVPVARAMVAPKPMSDARAIVRREYPLGTKLDAIAAMAGVSKQRVEQIARSLGFPQRKVTDRHKLAQPKGLRKNASLVARAAAALEARNG